MDTPEMLKDFFISYTGADVEWARWLAQQLEAAGYTTIYQARDAKAGGNFVAQMYQAMRQAKRTIAVLSPEYLEARFTRTEWAEAFRRDPTGEYALLVPVRVKHCDLDGILGARVLYRSGGVDRFRGQHTPNRTDTHSSQHTLTSDVPILPKNGSHSSLY